MGPIANEASVGLASGPLVAPVLGRVVGMLTARADCPIDRLDDALLVADAIAAKAAIVQRRRARQRARDRPQRHRRARGRAAATRRRRRASSPRPSCRAWETCSSG